MRDWIALVLLVLGLSVYITWLARSATKLVSERDVRCLSTRHMNILSVQMVGLLILAVSPLALVLPELRQASGVLAVVALAGVVSLTVMLYMNLLARRIRSRLAKAPRT